MSRTPATRAVVPRLVRVPVTVKYLFFFALATEVTLAVVA